MVVIGVTGGIASGKTLVTNELTRLGAVRIDADREGHTVLALPEIKRAMRTRWGDAILRPDGAVDRAAIARRVFAPPPYGPRELAFLEQLTHPRIERQLTTALEAVQQNPDAQRVVLDAALLHEAGWAKYCDYILFVDCPTPVRRQRACQRGWSEAEFQAREMAQQPLADKRRQADLIISTAGTRSAVRHQVGLFWRSLDKQSN